MYRTYLTSFGRSVYEGDDLQAAKSAAVNACFESVIYENEMPVLAYCSISGWRGLIELVA